MPNGGAFRHTQYPNRHAAPISVFTTRDVIRLSPETAKEKNQVISIRLCLDTAEKILIQLPTLGKGQITKPERDAEEEELNLTRVIVACETAVCSVLDHLCIDAQGLKIIAFCN